MTMAREIPSAAAAAGSPAPARWQLPPPPEAFTGRGRELRDLEAALTSGNFLGAAISGVEENSGGVGKTALALVLAQRFKDRHPDAHICLNLRGVDRDGRPPVTPGEAMQRVIHAFHPKSRLPEGYAALAPIYHAILAKAGRVLLLLDNAADAGQVHALLPPAKCLLLVTSRARVQVPGLAMSSLESLPAGDAWELLLKLAPRVGERAEEAAGVCGRSPLALGLFAGAVNNKKMRFVPELIESVREGREKLSATEAAFRTNYGLLDENLRRYMSLLAVFPGDFDLAAAGALFQGDAEYARGVLQPLVNAGLVEWNPTARRFHLHDLLRGFCESSLEEYELEGRAPPPRAALFARGAGGGQSVWQGWRRHAARAGAAGPGKGAHRGGVRVAGAAAGV